MQLEIQKNWTLLEQRWPILAEILKKTGYPQDFVIDDRYNNHCYVINNIHVSSAFNSQLEAEQQASLAPAESKEIACYGIGMGDLPIELLKRKNLLKLHVYLFNIEILKLLLDTTDQSQWLGDNRVALHFARETIEIKKPFATNLACLELAQRDSWNLRDRVQMELNNEFVSSNFREKQIVIENIKNNSRFVRNDKDVKELFNTHLHSEMSIVGAGPSLDQHYTQLKQSKLIVCVDRVLHLLIKKGIIPQYVVTADPHEVIFKYKDYPLKELKKIKLIYMPAAAGSTLEKWPGDRFTAYSDSPVYKDLQTDFPKAELFISGSVIHMAIDLAVKIGSTKLFLFGTDFCFINDKTHATGSPNKNSEPNTPYSDTEVFCWNKKSSPTIMNLKSYLIELERYIQRNSHISFVCMSDKGANISGTELYNEKYE